MTVIIMMMNARKEKGTEVGRCGAEAPMRLKVEQIENKGPVCGRGGGGKVERGKGPEEEKRGVKRWTRGLKDSERLANPNEGTIAEVCKNEIYICKSAPNPRYPPLPKTIGAKSRSIKELAARLITFIRRRTHAYARVEHVVTAAVGVREGRLEGKGTIKKEEKGRTSIGRTERA
ncbi:hypothetical protein ALC60_08083 [Trachymyrmex zeteki]|uniref:Uncharacterized protein n=1 Tax=Mycetomoellerius zeteki TaxID=64791 RepID=A0A151WY33_9HYME|nr:hypothetical protein ALC60_08083 [Trachymyrmex zeteki]